MTNNEAGGLYRTTDRGQTWTRLNELYRVSSCTIDPGNPHIVWVGTGENVGGRHMGYGDGVYRSDDGGATWENMGLATALNKGINLAGGKGYQNIFALQYYLVIKTFVH